MNINLTRKEVKRLIQSLSLATDYQGSSIDSYKTHLVSRGGRIISCFPKDKETRSFISQWNRDIKSFNKIMNKLRMNLLKK